MIKHMRDASIFAVLVIFPLPPVNTRNHISVHCVVFTPVHNKTNFYRVRGSAFAISTAYVLMLLIIVLYIWCSGSYKATWQGRPLQSIIFVGIGSL